MENIFYVCLRVLNVNTAILYITWFVLFPGKFQVEFDVQDFHPEELSIKTEGDVLIVLAKRETKTESGGSFVSKQFEQRFTLPSGVKPEAITSALSKDGTLTVTAPRETLQLKQEIGGFKKTRGSITAEAPGSGQWVFNYRVLYCVFLCFFLNHIFAIYNSIAKIWINLRSEGNSTIIQNAILRLR